VDQGYRGGSFFTFSPPAPAEVTASCAGPDDTQVIVIFPSRSDGAIEAAIHDHQDFPGQIPPPQPLSRIIKGYGGKDSWVKYTP